MGIMVNTHKIPLFKFSFDAPFLILAFGGRAFLDLLKIVQFKSVK